MATDLTMTSAQFESYVVKNSSAGARKFDNVLTTAGQRAFPSAKISCDIYKTTSPFNSFVRPMMELGHGAHYYVYAPTGYTKASITIPLNEALVKNLNGNNRRAYISMGLHSDGSVITQCDVGIGRDHDSEKWMARCYCRAYSNLSTRSSVEVFEQHKVKCLSEDQGSGYEFGDSGTLRIDYSIGSITVSGARKDFLRCEYFLNNSKVAWIEFRCKSAGLNVNAQFIRFMSLIPLDNLQTSDDKDDTALSAAMHDIKLYNGSTSYTWDSNRTAHAWIMQRENAPRVCLSNLKATETIGATMDYANLVHSVQTH